MAEQLALDFQASVSMRMRRARKVKEKDALQPQLFVAPPNIDVHLHSPAEAVAHITGQDADRTINWLQALVGSVRVIKSKRVAFPSETLDRLLHIRPPAQVTLDAAATAVARAIWARKLGLKPLKVTRERQRLIASSPRWPGGFGVKDAPWSTIATLLHLGVPVDVDPRARNLMTNKLAGSGTHIATAGLAGSAVMFEARQPQLLENLGLPALSYAGEPRSGLYKMPLLAAEPLLSEDSIKLSPDLQAAIKKATAKVKPLETREDFPWTLYKFQAKDAAIGKRILETTGGTLLAGEMGSGKAQPVSTPVLTVTGWRRIGDLKPGDLVMGRDGTPYPVTGAYERGPRSTFRVTLSDGSEVLTCDEHLWAVDVHNENSKRRREVISLAEIAERGLRHRNGWRFHVPLVDPIQYPEAELPLDPYVLGALIGDGLLTGNTPGICAGMGEEEVAEQVALRLPAGLELREGVPSNTARCWNIVVQGKRGRPVGGNPLKKILLELGLWGKPSYQKRIPEPYLRASVSQRLGLLRGLMDTDGSTRSSFNSATFKTTSAELVRDMYDLVESLGGVTSTYYHGPSKYEYKGQQREKRAYWGLTINLPEELNPFCIRSKASELKVRKLRRRAIISVTALGKIDSRCIAVGSPDRLYITERHVPVHNTTVSLALAEDMEIWPLLVVAPLSAFSTWERQLSAMGKKVYLATDAPSKAWKEIENGGHDAVVVSFDRLAAFLEVIERYGFAGIIADEIQRIRTPGSRRSRALRALASNVPLRMGLSGTPLTNTLNDLLPVGAFLAPGEWKPRANTKDLEDLYPGDPIESIADHLGTLMVRRRMQDTGAKLPKRNDHRVYVQLTPEQRRALAELEAEAQAAKEAGEFDDPSQKMHAFVKLQRARAIINSPQMAGIGGPNPKVRAAVDLAEDFLSQGRKGVIFCADRTTFKDIGRELDNAGIGWVGIWGSTPPLQRIENERRFHQDPNVKVVVCTIQAGAESWSASPTGTWLISTAYMYQAAILEQMECRVYRMNSDPDGPDIEIMYLHSTAPGGTLDDRMVEILSVKKQLFAQVVDRTVHEDQTKVSYTMGDLVYLLTGNRDEKLDKKEADAKAAAAREQAQKDHAKKTLYAKKGKNKTSAEAFHDQGDTALTYEEYAGQEELDELLDVAEHDEGFTLDMETPEDDGLDDDGFDIEEGDD